MSKRKQPLANKRGPSERKRKSKPKTPTVKVSRAHELVVRLNMQMSRNIAFKYFPRRSLLHRTELSLALERVITGHSEADPMTATKLAEDIGVHHKTASLWLNELVGTGYVEREKVGREVRHWLTEKTDTPDMQRLLEENRKLIIKTADELRDL